MFLVKILVSNKELAMKNFYNNSILTFYFANCRQSYNCSANVCCSYTVAKGNKPFICLAWLR